MFFVISKILAFLVNPLFWVTVLLLWAIFIKSQVKRKRLLVFVVIVFFLLSNKFLFDEAARKWEGSMPVGTQVSSVYDVGIVLGGFASYDTLSHNLKLSESGDRIWQTISLYKAGTIKKILISGGTGSLLHRKVTEADHVYDYLLAIGIPRKDLLMESNSRNTRENAVESARLLNENIPDARCLLITSAFHMKRSLGCFRKVHLDVTPYRTDFLAERRKWDPDKLLIPSAASLKDWHTLIREIVGYYTYKIAGYI
jgi:uncharacterized SAM-binding protein YcdF (DUF218 family)